jgi:hypothetical protein
MNKPYKKIVDENGKVVNPITKESPYVSQFKSRQQRRKKEPRFIGNNRGVSISYVDSLKPHTKLKRRVQVIGKKRVCHYDA